MWPGLEHTIYRTRAEHANYYTTDAVIYNNKTKNLVYLFSLMFFFYLFTHTGVQQDFPVRWCSCRSTVTLVLLVEQELLTFR